MSKHVAISPEEAADRLAIRELVEAYTHCADRRDAKGQMALFTPDTHFVIYMNAKDPKPSQELHSREALAPVFADLNKYSATMHFVGQSTILMLTADRGTELIVANGVRGLARDSSWANWATNWEFQFARHSLRKSILRQALEMVAGVRFELTTFGL